MTYKADILRIGAEPLVLWDRDEETDLYRFTIMVKDWTFGVQGVGQFFVDGEISGVPTRDMDGEPLVPSDEPVDVEHGLVSIFGYSIDELRSLYLRARPVAPASTDPNPGPAREGEPEAKPRREGWRPWRRGDRA